jgi:polysaccharide transporter, PST family
MLNKLLKNVHVRNVAWLYVVQFSSYLMPLITLPYLSRVLSPEKFGLVAYSQSIMWYFVTLTDYSFNFSATREVAIHRDDKENLSKLFSSVMAAKTLLTVAGFLVLMATVFAVPKLRAHWELYPLAFLTVTGNFFFPLWLFQGLQKLEQAAIRDFLAKLLGIIALFGLVHKDSDYAMATAVQGGSVAIAGLIGLLTVPFIVKLHWRRPE